MTLFKKIDGKPPSLEHQVLTINTMAGKPHPRDTSPQHQHLHKHKQHQEYKQVFHTEAGGTNAAEVTLKVLPEFSFLFSVFQKEVSENTKNTDLYGWIAVSLHQWLLLNFACLIKILQEPMLETNNHKFHVCVMVLITYTRDSCGLMVMAVGY